MENKTLFTIGQEYLSIEEQLIENEGELTPELEQALTLNKEELSVKGQNYIAMIRKLESDAEIAQTEMKRIAQWAKVKQNAANRLKENLFNAMTAFGIDKIEMQFTTLSLRNNPPSVVLEIDEKQLPERFIRKVESISADKVKLKEALQAGEVIEGVRLEVKKSLSIK